MKAVISRLTLVLVIVMVALLLPLSSYADSNPLTLACPSGNLQVGVPYSSVLVATGGNLPYTFLVLPANPNYNPPLQNLPSGLTLNSSTGALTGTPASAGSYLVEFEVYDAQNQNQRYAYCTFVVAVPAPLSVTCQAGSTGDVGVPFSSGPMTVTGGVAPYMYSIVGTLPPGLTLNTSTGAVTGTPTAAGTFTVKVTDAAGNSSTSCMITINGPLAVTCAAINTGDVGVAFDSGPMNVTGGTAPYTYSIVGTLPPGLTLNTSTGEVTGTPTAAGTFSVRATDAVGNSSTSCMITINGPLSVTCATINTGEVGVAFNSGPMTVTGGTPLYTYSIVGTLPPGLMLNTSTGAVMGTPSAPGTFMVRVTDAVGNSSTSCTITINGPLAVTCAAVNTGDVGIPFNSGPMTVAGGVAPYTFSIVGTLPAGLTLNTATGAVTGLPTASGTFSVQVTDALGNTSTGCMIIINGPLSVNCSAFNTGEVGVLFDSGPMTVTGGTAPYTFSIGSATLPAGLTLNPSTGEVTGTPTASGSFSIEVTDALGNSSTSCMITITGPLSVTCSAFSTGEVGVPFDSGPMTVTGGTAPYTFSIGNGPLPAGLTLNPSTGEVTGTPTTPGAFTVQVTDSLGGVGTACAISINPPLSVTCAANNTGTVGVPFNSGPVTVTGGAAPYSFSIVGTLPAGLTLNTSTGAVTGTPTTSGTFTVQVTDALGNVGTACAIAINPPVSASCVSLNAVQGVAITPVTMTGSGGAGGPYTFTATGLPPGLSISSNGTISGTPTSSGTFPYTVTVSDSAGNKGTVNCSVTVAPAVSASCVAIIAVQGVAITPVTMTGSGGAGGPYTFTATGLPPGLSISSGGTISGTPTLERHLPLHGDGDRLGGQHGHGELLGDGGSGGERELRVHQRGAGRGDHAGDHDGQRRGGWTLHLHGDGPASGPEHLQQRHHLGNANLQRHLPLHGDGDRLGGQHGHGELLGDGGSGGERELRGHQRRAGRGDHAGDHDGQRRRGWTLHLHGDGPASGPEHLQQRDHFGNANAERHLPLHGDGDRQRRATRAR